MYYNFSENQKEAILHVFQDTFLLISRDV